MKLSDLVRVYNQLCLTSTADVRKSTDVELQKIMHISDDATLGELRSNLLGSFDRFEAGFEQYKRRIYDQIREMEPPYLQESYRQYEENRGYRYQWLQKPHPSDSIEVQEKNTQWWLNDVLTIRLLVTAQTEEFITNRINRCSGWQTTTMILRPGIEPWLQNMVGNDPIYLVDENYELLTPSMSQFNELYQRRLRTYVIREDTEDNFLWQLPENQFGLVLAWNYFDRKPFEIVRRYLIELYSKLRPGGMLLMTFNDCDRWPGVLAAELGNALYTPGILVKSFAESLGFEVTFTHHENGPWTWLELRKPGEWISYRGGQALARIVPK